MQPGFPAAQSVKRPALAKSLLPAGRKSEASRASRGWARKFAPWLKRSGFEIRPFRSTAKRLISKAAADREWRKNQAEAEARAKAAKEEADRQVMRGYQDAAKRCPALVELLKILATMAARGHTPQAVLAMIQEAPAATQTEEAMVQQAPAATQTEEAMVQQAPAATQTEEAMVQEAPAATQTEEAMVQEAPAATQTEEAMVQEAPAATQTEEKPQEDRIEPRKAGRCLQSK